jgi:sphingomyelin phosphodiesterase acid-like 3
MRLRTLLLFAVVFALSPGLPAQAANNSTVVLLSDIHFNPFPPSDQCATPDGKLLMAHLLDTGPEQWNADDFRLQRPTTLGQDSSYALMAGALHAAHDAAPKARLVLRTCYAGATQAQQTRLAAGTVEFVTLQVKATFPQAQIVPVLGNNDTDGGDYQLPSPAFLAELNTAWASLAKHNAGKAHADFSSFARGGYFSVPLGGWKHLRAVVLNSVLWSSKFSAVGQGTDPAAGDAELEWLQTQLSAAYLAGDKVIVLGHIPPGLDAYATRMARGTRIVTMYRDCGGSRAQGGCQDYAHAVPAMLQRFHSTALMGIFGHTHQNEFRVAGEGANAVPLLIVPSVSPIFQNNPSFLVADTDAAFHITDFRTVYLPMSGNEPAAQNAAQTTTTPAWQQEFDFDHAYAQPRWDATSLTAITRLLKRDAVMRAAFFLRMSSGSQFATVPTRWQDAYLCGLTHLSAETVLPCVAESQLDLPLP